MMTKNNIDEWLNNALKQLEKRSEFPLLEIQVLLAHVINKPREWLISHPDEPLSDTQVQAANEQLTRLLNGVPLPYITGRQAFFGLDFVVSPDVLIPRPETEQLVEECIQWLEEHPTKRKMVDVGTGSGVIAVTLADHFDDLEVTAMDISDQALEIARQNAEQFRVDQKIVFLKNDLLDNCKKRFDLIAANLPYIPTETLKTLPVSRHEPVVALDGGEDGLDLISRLLSRCEDHIKPGGMIILEIESGQSNSVLSLANSLLPRAKTTLLFDLAKLPRIIKIQI
jgi:release factor glutamine methyltransferase